LYDRGVKKVSNPYQSPALKAPNARNPVFLRKTGFQVVPEKCTVRHTPLFCGC